MPHNCVLSQWGQISTGGQGEHAGLNEMRALCPPLVPPPLLPHEMLMSYKQSDACYDAPWLKLQELHSFLLPARNDHSSSVSFVKVKLSMLTDTSRTVQLVVIMPSEDFCEVLLAHLLFGLVCPLIDTVAPIPLPPPPPPSSPCCRSVQGRCAS